MTRSSRPKKKRRMTSSSRTKKKRKNEVKSCKHGSCRGLCCVGRGTGSHGPQWSPPGGPGPESWPARCDRKRDRRRLGRGPRRHRFSPESEDKIHSQLHLGQGRAIPLCPGEHVG